MTFKTTDVSAKLSKVLLINSSRFSTVGATQQTAILANSGGLPVVFIESFSTFANRKRVRDALLNGTDVSTELEFLGIELNDEQLRVVSMVSPILTLLGAPTTGWSEGTDTLPVGVTVNNTRVYRNDYYISLTAFKQLWRTASRYWYRLDNPTDKSTRKPDQVYISTSSSSRYATYEKDRICIGCQIIPRVEVEAIARHLELEWNIPA